VIGTAKRPQRDLNRHRKAKPNLTPRCFLSAKVSEQGRRTPENAELRKGPHPAPDVRDGMVQVTMAAEARRGPGVGRASECQSLLVAVRGDSDKRDRARGSAHSLDRDSKTHSRGGLGPRIGSCRVCRDPCQNVSATPFVWSPLRDQRDALTLARCEAVGTRQARPSASGTCGVPLVDRASF
jgi:hypothetical protein